MSTKQQNNRAKTGPKKPKTILPPLDRGANTPFGGQEPRRGGGQSEKRKKKKARAKFSQQWDEGLIKTERMRQENMKFKLSDCSRNYLTALVDPWSVAELPCIPDNLTIQSFKFGARARGVFACGVEGVGWIAMAPATPAKDWAFGKATNQDYTATTYDSTLETGVFNIFNDSPMVTNEYRSTTAQHKTFRLVGGGLAIRYVGNEMNRGGQVTIYRSQDNSPTEGPLTMPDLLAVKESVTTPVDRKWHHAIWKPSNEEEFGYHASDDNEDDQFGGLSLIIMISGAEPKASFEFDMLSWFEVVGPNLPTYTHSFSDPLGVAAVSNILSTIQPNATMEETKQLAHAVVQGAIVKTFSHMGDFANALFSGGTGMVGKVLPVLKLAL